ncbi:MAG TPA: translocation/assembly module TamB domain-containing protein, partial [Pseudoxanthomonas sp.]|nr:translocation/assembly module TamB domain-containing protein [Pseudoxanthomonas sp.]
MSAPTSSGPASSTPASGMPGPAAPRRRFYRRKRFWQWSGAATAALIVGVIVLLYWLLQTVAGRDVLLAQIVARLPAGSTFTWERAEGPVAGPLILHGVDFRFGEIHFAAQRLHLDLDLRPLLGRRLRLDVLRLTNATLELPEPAEEPFELPRWPESLPKIEMPIAIQADVLEIDGLRVRRAGEPLIDVRWAEGALDIGNGYFETPRLLVDSDLGRFDLKGGYAPRDGYATDVAATAVFPAPRGRTPARIGLIAQGNRQKMAVGIGGSAPAPLRVELDLRGEENPDWRLRGRTEQLDLMLLGLTEQSLPLAFDLRATGTNGKARLQGRLRQGELEAVIQPSNMAIADEVLTVEPLAVRVLDGLATLRGRADFTDPENPAFKFAINARGLRWGGAEATAIAADADFGFAGRLQDWAAIGKATLTRDGERATLEFDGRGDREQVRLETLNARMPSGRLDATGSVGWAPQLRWDLAATLDGFDPGYFAADWNGNVSGRLASKGQARDGGGFDASLDVPDLGGSLRGRPLDGRGRFVVNGGSGSGQLALQLGQSRVTAQGSIGAILDIDAQLQPLRLDDLLPGAEGRLAGTVNLSGPRTAPNLQADLSGSDLKWNDYGAATFSLRGRLPWRGSGGDLALRGTAVSAGAVLDRLQVDARGAVENLALDARASNAMGSVALAGIALRRGGNWQGSLDALQLAPSKGAAWRLQQPARFGQSGSAWKLAQACLGASGGGALCASADWPREGVVLNADALPLTLLQPWLPPNKGRPLQLRGNMSLDGRFRPRGNAWEGELHLASLDGGLKLGTNARREIVRYDNFTFDAVFDPQRIEARLGTGFKGEGYVDARFTTGWEAFAPLRGDLYFHDSELFWLELFSPDLVRPTGVLAGHIGLAGTRAQPALSGEAQLTEFRGELPALGITLVDGSASLAALADGSARISGSMGSVSSTGNGAAAGGKGRLNIDGTLAWKGEETPLQFNIRGSDFLAADVSEVRAIIAPDLQVGLVDNTIRLRGQVAVPTATIDVERYEGGVSVSEDVVVLDPIDPEEAPASALDMELTLVLGEDVELRGYGLEGSLAGSMRVRSRPGQEMLATGRLDVDGEYTAYGQDLDITRGELTWSNNPVSDPRVNIRAQREIV